MFRTVGYSGADIRNLVNEAGIMAVSYISVLNPRASVLLEVLVFLMSIIALSCANGFKT